MIIKCKMCGGDIAFEPPCDRGCPLNGSSAKFNHPLNSHPIRSASPHATPCTRNCIQPSKPAERLYKSQAADGLAFLLYTISGFTCAICLRLFIRK